MSEGYWAQVQALREERAQIEAEDPAEDEDPAGPCWLCFGVGGYWTDEWRPCPQCKGSGYQPR